MANIDPSRRAFLGTGAAAGAALVVATGSTPADASAPTAASANITAAQGEPDGVSPGELDLTDSTFFSTAFVQYAGTYAAPGSDGDLWANCWADDDNVYAANGDGRGFSDEPFKDVVVNRIMGTPETGLTGVKLAESDEVANVWADPTEYNRKPTGMVCVHGTLYLAVQDLRFEGTAFDDVPNASISRSDDHGRTWHKTSEPMFTDYRFTTVFFADFGKNAAHAKSALGDHDGSFVYAFGLDWNWRASNAGVVPDPVDVYLGRVPDTAVQDRSQWQFFTGTDARGRPMWSTDIVDKVPVLHDPVRRFPDPRPTKAGNLTVISQGGVLYVPAYRRYIYSSWTDPSFEFYEAPQPWGPWRRFHYLDSGLTTWYQQTDPDHTPKNGGYATTMPSKYASRDGRHFWMQSNWWQPPVPTPQDNYNFNLRQVKVTPYRATKPTNRPDAHKNLARRGSDVTPHLVSAKDAHWTYLNDNDRTKSENSYDGTNKLTDHWGYTFSQSYTMNRVVYTTGEMTANGGWFSRYAGGLAVQVRQDFEWVDVAGLTITPDYPYSAEAGPFHAYTLRFDAIAGDGVRIIGQPGGPAHVTSIAELEVYYDLRSGA